MRIVIEFQHHDGIADATEREVLGIRVGEVADKLSDDFPGFTFGDTYIEESPARVTPETGTEQRVPLLLAGDEIHVVLDCLPSSGREIGAPWDGYDTDPVDDPKSTETGWWHLLRSAQEKLNAELSRL